MSGSEMSLKETARLVRDFFECNRFTIFIIKIVVPPLPSKALKRQLPFRGDDGIYEEDFIEERRSGLEGFINK